MAAASWPWSSRRSPRSEGWFAALDQRLQAAAGFFTDRPVVVDLAAAFDEGGRDAALIVLDGLEARSLRLVGIEGIDPRLLAGTRWAELPKSLQGRELSLPQPADPPSRAGAPAPEEPAPANPSLLIDRPVRSGQSIVFAEGDVIVVGTVNSGAEVIAGGSIHVYGALRGRAIAGLRVGPSARIFAEKMEAELVGVDQLYRTAEHWGSGVHGRPVQIRCDRER